MQIIPIISFVIPVYNGEKYLSKCIESICNQDMQGDICEVICVNDFSQDGSEGIIREYQKKYPNIKLINQPTNSKTGTACNVGVDNAQGKYIWIVGQDDLIAPDCLQRLIEKCESEELDVLAFNYRRINEQEEELHSAVVFQNSEVMSGHKFLETYFDTDFEHYLLGYIWRAIFRKDFLSQKNIRFKDGVIYEDTVFLFKSIFYADRIASISDFLYYYRVNSYSITDINKKYKGNLIYEFAFVAGSEVYDLANEIEGLNKKYADILYKKAIWYFQSFTYKVVGAKISEKKKFYQMIKANKNVVLYFIQFTSLKEKILIHPFLGFFLSVILKPFYILKNRLKYRNNPKQDWCY